MDLRPWKLWTPDGSPAPGTEEITSTLEGVLAKHPDHPGANHYYIHAEEAGPNPEKALDAAKRLPGLMPGAGHIVHMPCHIYIHTGMWAEASDANEHAIVADKAYLAKPHAEGIYSMMYVAHNHMFLWFSAGMEGRRDRSVQAAKDLNSLFDTAMVVEMNKSMPGSDYFLAPYYFALVRFGMWKEILAEPAPPAELRYLTAVWHFARAFASARTGNMKQAHDEQAALEHFAAALKDDEMVGPLNSAKAVFGVATQLLAGELEAAAGHRKNAIALEKEAVKREVALGYDEPPPWPLSTRQYLGALLLEDHRAADAIAVYQADLAKYPENGWSLFGLAEAYKQRKAHEEKSVRDRFTKAWAHADVTLASSRF
jgi:tetratricopeptide (TPR) repeat protein